MNCLCDMFDNSTTWLIIIALLILFYGCNGYGCGAARCDGGYRGGECGGGCNNHCC